jgi:hypothetical protein
MLVFRKLAQPASCLESWLPELRLRNLEASTEPQAAIARLGKVNITDKAKSADLKDACSRGSPKSDFQPEVATMTSATCKDNRLGHKCPYSLKSTSWRRASCRIMLEPDTRSGARQRDIFRKFCRHSQVHAYRIAAI